MLTSILTGPDGNKYKVTHPEGASREELLSAFQQYQPQGRPSGAIDADDPLAVDVLKGLFTGGGQAAVSSAAGLTQWAGQTFQSEGMLEAAEDMRQYSQGIGENIGLDQNFRESFFGQVVQGLGQVPVTIGAGAAGLVLTGGNPLGMLGAAALTTGGQMTSEFLTDMEQTVGKQYTDFNSSEKEAALTGMLAQTALGTTLELAAVGKAVRPLLRRIKSGKGVSSKALKKAIEKDKGALREILESGAAEGFTEASQGQSLDTLASMLYDEDRELLTMDTLKRRSMEFGVGAVVGGTVSAGSQILGSPGKTSTSNKDLGKPVEGRSEVSVPREIQVTYKPVDGPTTTVTLAPDEGESAIDAAERILEGRRLPGSDMTVNEVIEQTPIDVVLGEPDAEILEEDVPVEPAPTPAPDPEPAPEQAPEGEGTATPQERLDDGFAVNDLANELYTKATGKKYTFRGGDRDLYLEAEAKAEEILKNKKVPEPSVETAPESEPTPAPDPTAGKTVSELAQEVGITEQNFRKTYPDLSRRADERARSTEAEVDPRTGLPGFNLPQNLRKGQPGYYQTQNIKFASDLERAAYSATTSTRDETAKSKRSKYRKILQDAGYSNTEINTMGREVRSQMRDQYDGAGSELSVALPQDLVADAFSTYIPFRYTGKNPKETPPPFFKQFNPEGMTEGNFVDLKTGESLNNKTFAGGNIRVENDRPVLETSEVEATALNKRDRKQGRLVKTNLFRRSAGWNWTKEPENAPQTTLVSVEGYTAGTKKSKHYYTTNFVSNNPLTLDPRSQADEPRGRPYTKGDLKLGNVIGEVVRAGVKSPVYDTITVGEDIVAQAAPLETKAKKVTRDYNLLNSPFINNYSGPGPSNTSVPDYDSFHYVVSSAQQKGLNAAIQSGAVDTLADQVVEEATGMMSDPSLAAGIGWYGRMRERLGEIFGADIEIFTQLLGTTSAQTPVEANFRFSVDLYNRFKAGEFDSKIKKYLKLYGQMREGQLGQLILKEKIKNSKGVLYTREMIRVSSDSALLSSAATHYKLEPRKTSGKKYGTNSYPALKALSQVWFDDRLGKNRMTPKTPQFTMNLNGESLEATIDVWAARLLRRVIYSGEADARIIPSQETAVNNPDFALGQLVFRRAAEKLNMNPDDLQALVWFGEKQIWDRNGWTGAAGALKSSFDEPASVFYPSDGSTRTEADANLILDFLAKERLVKRNIDFPDAVSKTSQNKTRKEYDQFLRKNIIVDYLQSRGSGAVYESSSVESRGEQQRANSIPAKNQEDVTAQAAETAVEDRGPQDTFENGSQVIDFIEKSFNPIADKLGIAIRPSMSRDYEARYNVTQRLIEYNPMALLNRSKAGVQAAMREEIIHAAMHSVLIQKAKKTKSRRSESQLWVEFFTALGNNLTPQERAEMKNVYQTLQEGDTVGFGAEYSRAVVQKVRYGDLTEQYIALDKGSPAFQAVVELLRSVQAYMAKVLGPMVKTDPEAAQVIVDTVELLNAIDPAIRPKNQDVVANAYNATDKNTAEENTDPGESVDAKASERIREERKWFADSSLRKTASKFLTPVITRLNRINPMFGRLLQNLDTAIRERSFRYRKQTEPFFNRLNAIKGEEFEEMKQLLFFSPTPEEASRPRNKAKMQRRDALLHKYGLLNMYRLDVQPIMEEIYAEYTALGMPAMGYLEDYFPRVVKDLEGLIKSYGQKTKRTFELLVEEENKRRSEIKEDEGGPLPEMEKTELARFFQDFLQNKFRVDINGARLPGNVKVRDIQLIPADKLKFYDDPGIAFGKYTANMTRAIESFKVVGDTRKGRLQGKLGELTEELFSAGQIDQADAGTVKSLTELITTQFQAENEILKSLGTLTYMATLINPGPVLVQIMDLYKVALYRGLGGVVSGVYRTVTGNRRFDIEDDFSIAKTQLSAEFQDPSVLQKALDFGLSRLVPFRQMDTAMKHASIEAAYDDFAKKAKAPVGSKKYEQLLSELTITMGREDALKTIGDLKLGKAMESPLVKEALLAELLQRQPLTYLQVPEGYQTDPSKRLFYKLSTFMLLDLNYNRQEFMNDLGGPGKTLQQRTAALRRLTYMATLLTMFGLPSDMLDDWISGKDTYIPEHVMNNMLGMFGLSKYTTTRALEKGTIESVIQRFTPPAINIMINGEQSFRSWVKGDIELFEMKAWRNSPLSDVWYNRSGAGKESQKRLKKLRRKEGVRPTYERS